jgi:hypothetical protein
MFDSPICFFIKRKYCTKKYGHTIVCPVIFYLLLFPLEEELEDDFDFESEDFDSDLDEELFTVDVDLPVEEDDELLEGAL